MKKQTRGAARQAAGSGNSEVIRERSESKSALESPQATIERDLSQMCLSEWSSIEICSGLRSIVEQIEKEFAIAAAQGHPPEGGSHLFGEEARRVYGLFDCLDHYGGELFRRVHLRRSKKDKRK